MAAKVTFIPSTKTIKIKPGYTTIDFKIDIYSDGKEEWLVDEALNKFTFPIRAIGGNTLPGGKYLESTFFLRNGWQIEPDDSNHTLIIYGNLYHDDGIALFKFPTGYSIAVNLNTTTSPDKISGGEGASADEVWQHAKALTLQRFIALK